MLLTTLTNIAECCYICPCIFL